MHTLQFWFLDEDGDPIADSDGVCLPGMVDVPDAARFLIFTEEPCPESEDM